MPGTGFSWTVLVPSHARERWLLVAAAASGALALILLWPAWREPTPSLGAAAFAAGLAAVAAFVSAQRTEPSWALLVDADGAIWGRMNATDGEPTAAIRLVPSAVGRHLLVLSGASGPVAVWRDALPADRFRRLSVHARWHLERGEAASGPAPSGSARGT